MIDPLPPGPRMPKLLQTIGTWSRPTAFVERARARYGPRFTIRLLGQPPIVMITDPEEIKQIFQAPPRVPIGKLMATKLVTFHPSTRREEVERTFAKYGFRSVPVVDGEGRMQGVVRFRKMLEHLGRRP